MLRLFIALPIPDHISTFMVELQNNVEGAKWSPRENFHVTLRFLGDLETIATREVDGALGDIRAAPFDLALSDIGHFGHDTPHALWVGLVNNPDLLKVQKSCERACRLAGLEPDPRVYTPHATLGYLPRHQTLPPIMQFHERHGLFKSPSWTADRFYLYSSKTNGPGPSRFTIEAEYPLMG